jgi:hypothetical protein
MLIGGAAYGTQQTYGNYLIICYRVKNHLIMLLGYNVSNPYSTPDSDVSKSTPSLKVPWLWTIYNTFIIFIVLGNVMYVSTGKMREMFAGTIKADPSYSSGAPIAEAVLGLFVVNYLIMLVLVLVGYFLVWRVNRRNTWALYALTVFSLLWLALGIYSYVFSFSIPGYQVSMLDHVDLVIGTLFLIVIFTRPYFGWRKKGNVT